MLARLPALPPCAAPSHLLLRARASAAGVALTWLGALPAWSQSEVRGPEERPVVQDRAVIQHPVIQHPVVVQERPVARVSNDRGPDLLTPTWHTLGLMTGMRLTEAWLWPDPFAETRASILAQHYADAYTHPPKWDWAQSSFEWDGDRWQINALGHALFGAELYYRPRHCGASPWLALGFATLASTAWEYGFEASGVRPSALDLWYTPASGALLGEARYWGYKAAGKLETAWARGVLRGILDPLGELERALGAPC